MFTFKARLRFYSTILFVFIFTSGASAEPDYQREQRWEKEILPSVMVGEPIYITQKNQHQFLALYAEVDNRKMALVMAHGMGLHPDWGMISTLRQELFDHGYATLSVQMPILAANANFKLYSSLFTDGAERLRLAVNYLKRKGYQRIVIVSHSNGSRMSRVYMERNPKDITAWVSLSLTQGDDYEGITSPVFDLYGENDLSHVTNTALHRKNSIIENKLSKQMMIIDANHFFNDKENEMIEAIKLFLDDINHSKDKIRQHSIVSLMDGPTVTCGFGW